MLGRSASAEVAPGKGRAESLVGRDFGERNAIPVLFGVINFGCRCWLGWGKDDEGAGDDGMGLKRYWNTIRSQGHCGAYHKGYK